MNASQRQNILNFIEAYEKIDIHKLASEKYASEKDLTKISVGNYSLLEFINLTERMVKQLKAELDNGLWQLLPIANNFHNDFGILNLENGIGNLVNHINTSDFETAVSWLERLIYYQKVNGFWEKSNSNTDGITDDNLKKTYSALQIQTTHLTENIKQSHHLLEKIESANKEIEELKQKNEKNDSDIQTLLAEIAEVLSSAKQKRQQIEEIYQSQQVKLTEINEELAEEKAAYSEYDERATILEKKLSDLVTALEKKITESQTALATIEGKKTFMDEKEKEIIKLTGFAADSSLGHSFKGRASSLQWSSWIWLAVIVLLIGGTSYWIYIVFTELKSTTGNVWIDGTMNILKTIPAFIVLSFAVRQYSKERNLQEEYQFKQAVAVTLNAYADQLENETNKERIDLLRKTIAQLYTPPKIVPDSGINLFRSKSMNEAIKTLSDTTSKMLDIISKK